MPGTQQKGMSPSEASLFCIGRSHRTKLRYGDPFISTAMRRSGCLHPHLAHCCIPVWLIATYPSGARLHTRLAAAALCTVYRSVKKFFNVVIACLGAGYRIEPGIILLNDQVLHTADFPGLVNNSGDVKHTLSDLDKLVLLRITELFLAYKALIASQQVNVCTFTA